VKVPENTFTPAFPAKKK